MDKYKKRADNYGRFMEKLWVNNIHRDTVGVTINFEIIFKNLLSILITKKLYAS